MLLEQAVLLQTDMEERMTPKASGYAAPSGSSQTGTKIPRLTPRTARDDKKSSNSSPRPSKLPTPRSSGLRKSPSPELSQDKELKSLNVSKLKDSSIPKITTSKQHASPRHVITPRTLRTPSKVPHKHIRPTEIKPGAYPRQEKITTDSNSPGQWEQAFTHANEDLTKFADDLLESSSCDENLMQPLSEQLPPVAEFYDNDQPSVSQYSSLESHENVQISQDVAGNDASDDKENVHPVVPPLPLHLLEDANNTADAVHNSSNGENTHEG